MSQIPPSSGPDETANPYFAQQERVPDLDAATPVLKAEEAQRLNRKALFFLGASLLVILVVGLMVLTRGGGESRAQRAPRQERVSVPELPRAAQAAQQPAPPSLPLPAAEPIPLVASAPPPVPLPMPARTRTGEGGGARERTPSLRERRIQDANGVHAGPGSSNDDAALEAYAQQQAAAIVGAQAQDASTPPAQARRGSASRPARLDNPDLRMVRGTYLRCVMETRIITDLEGYSSCVVTEPVYSVNGRRELLPKGSKIYGTYEARDFVNNRAAVVWDRILTPGGIDISLSAPGVDNLGSSGIPGDYDGHWAERISGALMISLLSDAFKYAAAEHGPQSTEVGAGGIVVQEPFESNTARTVERLARQAVQDNLRRPPTVTINQGTVINVYVTRDVDFSGVLPQG